MKYIIWDPLGNPLENPLICHMAVYDTWYFESLFFNISKAVFLVKFVSDLRHVGGFLWVLLWSSTDKTWSPRYIWNTLESGVKHHNPTQPYPCNQMSPFFLASTYDKKSLCNWYGPYVIIFQKISFLIQIIFIKSFLKICYTFIQKLSLSMRLVLITECKTCVLLTITRHLMTKMSKFKTIRCNYCMAEANLSYFVVTKLIFLNEIAQLVCFPSISDCLFVVLVLRNNHNCMLYLYMINSDMFYVEFQSFRKWIIKIDNLSSFILLCNTPGKF
jgi:hypothetical protein